MHRRDGEGKGSPRLVKLARLLQVDTAKYVGATRSWRWRCMAEKMSRSRVCESGAGQPRS